MERPPSRNVLLVIAGPAGTGKTTLCDALVQRYDTQIERVVTATTRAPRPGERHGVERLFLSDEEFDRKIKEGAFYEWAQVHTYRYGSLKSVILDKLAGETDLVMNIDVQGAATFRAEARKDPQLGDRLVTVFILPASRDQLVSRLSERGQDDDAEIKRRVTTAEKEVPRWREFHYCFVSGSREEDFAAIDAIYRAEKHRVERDGADA